MEGKESVKIEMLHDLVLIKRDKLKEEKTTPGGVIIPEEIRKKEQMYTAEVVEVSKDVSQVSKGDKVVVGRFSGTDVKFIDNDEVYTVIKMEEILAIVREAADKS